MPLTASHRVSLLRDVISRLEMEDWSFLNLILDQFGVPTQAIWEGNVRSYLTSMLSNIKGDSLLELARHLDVGIDFDIEQPKPEPVPAFWRDGMFRLFISHLSEYRVFAEDLQKNLLNRGIFGFVAHRDIEPTAEWQQEIQLALSTCESLVGLLHPDFHLSHWTDQEIGFAMGRGIPVFSVGLGQVPYGFIGRFQAFPGAGKTAAVLAKDLFDGYRKNSRTRERFSEITMSLFENSVSFESAKYRIGLLEELSTWNASFNDRLRKAVKNNGQIQDSWNVPDRVKALIAKWS